MDSVEKIQNELIDKILSIKNKAFLKALSNLISSTPEAEGQITLTEAQKELLEISDKDIENGNLISQEAMDKRNLEWLKGL